MSVKLPIYKVKLVRDHVASFPSGIVEEPKATAEFFYRLIGTTDREHLAALFVSMGRPTGASIIGVGTLNRVGFHMRETFKAAVLAGAESIILAHNHPSGIAEPSLQDQALTHSLAESLALVDVKVLDHFIVAPGAFLSFAERGLL